MRDNLRIVALLLGLAALAACVAPAGTLRHPEKLDAPPRCSSCHDEAPRRLLDHTPGFARGHAVAAAVPARCELCHTPSSCADCHGWKEELVPAAKAAGRVGRVSLHRGDYLTQHRIDGRVDPVSCVGCHGRREDRRCAECHR